MRLHGRQYTRREIEAHVGRMEQLGGIRRMALAEGNETGATIIAVRTGAGLAYEVTPDKGMDISMAAFSGSSLAWQSANGDAHPSYYDDQGTGWLRTAAGGLFMTCGLISAGSPGMYDGRTYGQHGRAHHTPARQVSAESSWVGDEMELIIRGVIEETSIFGGHLRLRREIRSRMGENAIVIRDLVENAGFKACPHMMLYHFNFGYPLMTEETKIRFPGGKVKAREAELPIDGYDRWEQPDANYEERVYYHELPESPDGWAEVAVHQPRFPLAAGITAPATLKLAWKTALLPRLVQWKMPGAGVHALGIEPANCGVEGLEVERQRGTLRMLEPGESVQYELKLSIDASMDVEEES
ncbi:aldose 1-epimerase family protein [Paenibacillus rhizovicinus]|uniref:Aldose 1-epimerase family protein n=1 Tax=Paenibacillus rhizovicinus TaxID=2704463 RepID=A0A6C0NZ72_9BACL|nr:aldose 1-epimerase family protein [Paenibacillus rhizovicinus]QHW31236.1 aldose 1-epimerase family protein [Paenibacillus rhizovicinus]